MSTKVTAPVSSITEQPDQSTVDELPLLPATLTMVGSVVPNRWTLFSAVRLAVLGNCTVNQALCELELRTSSHDAIYDVRYALEQETSSDYKSEDAYKLLKRYLLASPTVETRTYLEGDLIVRTKFE